MCELLAPAGDFSCLKSAINAGADAIYVGGSKFSARAYAGNFSDDELIKAIRYTHLFGRKIYLTVNILLKNKEMDELYDYIKPLYDEGLDGVIIQDIGVVDFLREHFPGLELHGSTQMAITSPLGARFAKSLGISRVVPAREMSLEEMKKIKSGSGLEIECFIHGAMCYCYSGMCLFSSMLGERSGNRGRCAQPCRLPYSPIINGNEQRECYPLSLKDMCTLEHIKELIDAGIDSFKIEGRMKSPEYVAGVTSIYRKYIDMVLNEGVICLDPRDIKALESLYIRSQRMDGYYFRRNGREMLTLESPAYSGNDVELIEQIREKYIDRDRKLMVRAKASFVVGEKATIEFIYGEHNVFVEGDIVEESLNRPISNDDILKQISKLGDTVFYLDELEIESSNNAFYRLKGINELRREAIAGLEELLLSTYNSVHVGPAKHKDDESCIDRIKHTNSPFSYIINCKTYDHLKTIAFLKDEAKERISCIYVDGDILLQLEDKNIIDKIQAADISILVALPYIIRESDSQYLDRILKMYESESAYQGFFVRNYQGLQWAIENAPDSIIHCDHYLYAFNKYSSKVLNDRCDAYTLPLELTSEEQQWLLREDCEDNYIKIVYGYVPMMITANCIMKTMKKCIHGDSFDYIRLNDRKNMNFNVEIRCDHCYNVIYNSLPLMISDKKDKISRRVIRRIDLTFEGDVEIVDILDHYLCGKSFTMIPEHTTGHDNRAVL